MSFATKIGNFIGSVVDRVRFGWKSLQIFYQQSLIPQSLLGGSVTGLRSNVLMSPVMWVMRAFTEAQLVVQRRREDAGGGIIWDRVTDHAVEMLIDKPNESYDGDALWKGTALSYVMSGNAYWRKVRNVFGDVIQLWYMPHWLVTPVYPADGSVFISHYDYTSGGLGGPEHIPTRDVVHFRFGLDPENPRLGYSPLQAVLREVLTDDEAGKFSQKILENMGVPGLIVSPKEGIAKPEERDRLQNYFNEGFKGDRRGMALVMGKATEVSQFGFDPNKLMLANLRDISEERVCSAIGIPAAVVGFGSGLQSTKVGATMRELVKLAWVQCVTPMQTSLAKQATNQLLPDFVGDNFRRLFRARFDTSEVSAFQEEAASEAERITLLVEKNVLRIDRAQHILGLEVDPKRQVYFNELVTAAAPVATATAPPKEAEDAEIVEDDTETETDAKLLQAIASRHGFTNGNGTH
jgi:HK97 family phage portal protein